MKNNFRKLPREFYYRKDLLNVSRELLGKFLITNFDGVITGGMITELEAYNGIIDKASHAFNGRRTQRNEIMYAVGGTAYIYICYGIHHLFNVVTNDKEIPHAILIRAVEPKIGIDEMMRRRKMNSLKKNISSGPGAMSVALGININHNGIDLLGNQIWIEDRGIKIPESKITETKRIGVESAGKDALLDYRFYISDNPFISKR